MPGPNCPYCSLELHSARQRECRGCGKPVDAAALEAIAEAMKPKTATEWAILNEIPNYRYQEADTAQQPREVEYEDVTRKRLPAHRESSS